jgi:hypothetical protein
MKIRSIVESYADLPDEDEFSSDFVCASCGGDEDLHHSCENCHSPYCDDCLRLATNGVQDKTSWHYGNWKLNNSHWPILFCPICINNTI